MRTFKLKDKAIVLSWNLLKSDGTAFSLSGYTCELYYSTAKGRSAGLTCTVSGTSSNVVSWTFAKDDQVFAGNYTMVLVIRDNLTGAEFTTLTYNNAFALYKDYSQGGTEAQTSEGTNTLTIFSSCEYGTFQPVIPTIGTNGNWYVNGVDTGTASAAPVLFACTYGTTTYAEVTTALTAGKLVIVDYKATSGSSVTKNVRCYLSKLVETSQTDYIFYGADGDDIYKIVLTSASVWSAAIVSPVKQVFMGTYTSSTKSTFAQLESAFNEGLAVFLKVNNLRIYALTRYTSSEIVFTCSIGTSIYTLSVESDNTWSSASISMATTSEVNAKYTKPSSGIPESDLASAVKEQLTFRATYETTTASEIAAALSAGKVVTLKRGIYVYTLVDVDNTTTPGEVTYTFICPDGQYFRAISLSNGTWIDATQTTLALATDVASKYTKPSTGIPSSDLTSAVQTSLGKADSAIQGVKVNDSELTPDANKKVNISAYVPGASAIPETDLATAVQTKLNKERLFWVTKGATTHTEVQTALTDGKLCVMLNGGNIYVLSSTTEGGSNGFGFYANGGDQLVGWILKSDNTWTSVDTSLATDAELASAISTHNSSSTAHSSLFSAVNTRIDNISAMGRFLSIWDCSTGLPVTNPTQNPYPYRSGDYYIVGKVSANTNWKPSGISFVIGTASTTAETGTVQVNDVYKYDGSAWSLISVASRTVTFASLSGNARDNTDLNNQLDSVDKVKTAVYGTTSFATMKGWLDAGNVVRCIMGSGSDMVGYATYFSTNKIHFITSSLDDGMGGDIGICVVANGNGGSDMWSYDTFSPEYTGEKVTSLSSSSTDSQYPSAKCVYDALESLPYAEDMAEARADIDAIDIDNLGDVRAKSIDMDELPKVCGYPLFVFGTAAPTVTPDFAGQFFIDTTNHKVYLADGVANAASYRVLN